MPDSATAVEAPDFVVCECGFHGRFVFSDGTESGTIRSIEEGRRIIDQALFDRRIRATDAAGLRKKLHESDLPSFLDNEAIQAALDEIRQRYAGSDKDISKHIAQITSFPT